MSGAGCYKIDSYVTYKAFNVVHLSECDRCYGSADNTKTLYVEVLAKLNKQQKLGELAGLYALGSVWVVVK